MPRSAKEAGGLQQEPRCGLVLFVGKDAGEGHPGVVVHGDVEVVVTRTMTLPEPIGLGAAPPHPMGSARGDTVDNPRGNYTQALAHRGEGTPQVPR
jgi:hypothetical protein